MSQGFRPPRDFPPPPRTRSLVIWPSPGRDPQGSHPPLGGSPPPKVWGFRPPPPLLRFRSSYFLYIIGVKNNGEMIGHFDTCTNYSRCSQKSHIQVVNGACAVRLSVIFIFCEFRRIANKNFLKNLLVLSSSLNYFCLKQTSWKFANTNN